MSRESIAQSLTKTIEAIVETALAVGISTTSCVREIQQDKVTRDLPRGYDGAFAGREHLGIVTTLGLEDLDGETGDTLSISIRLERTFKRRKR